jgi:hypothetical protein
MKEIRLRVGAKGHAKRSEEALDPNQSRQGAAPKDVKFTGDLPQMFTALRPAHRRSSSLGGKQRMTIRRSGHIRSDSATGEEFPRARLSLTGDGGQIHTLPGQPGLHLSVAGPSAEDVNPRGHKRHRSGDVGGRLPEIELSQGTAKLAFPDVRLVMEQAPPRRISDPSLPSWVHGHAHAAQSKGQVKPPKDSCRDYDVLAPKR